MLGLAEYSAASAELLALGKAYEKRILENVDETTTKKDATAYIRSLIPEYTSEYQLLLDNAMREIAQNAVDYYQNKLGLDDLDTETIVNEVVQQQYTERYYGATLNQRLTVNQRTLVRRATQTLALGPQKLATLFTSAVPFGSQTAIDKRVLLGTAAKIENDVAKTMADHAGIKLIRWTLSVRHKHECMCDDYANAVDGRVVRYMQENNIRENPRGLYFVDGLPKPPHPNCQCEYAMVVGNRTQAMTRARRTVAKVKSILRRLRKR